ncbi:hypothetical protein BY996DRAFT_6612485 [Phakopsora pachyrhizi]|nr:hypothetical protein BY996DRAFT_6612485 [Phakopsora pachyrhizi]
MIFLVITNEQTLVNKNSSQTDDHLLTPENSIKPLVVSQQPLLTRLSKGYKSQTDHSSSSSPILDVGNEIGTGLPGLTTEESKGHLEGADNDPHPLGFNQTQSSHQDLSLATALNIPLEVDSQPFHNPSCTQPCPAISFVFQTREGNPIEMDENLEEPHIVSACCLLQQALNL